MSDLDELNELLCAYIRTPTGSVENLNLGKEYHRLGQWASAITHLLKAAEYTDDCAVRYESLLRMHLIYFNSDDRKGSAMNCVQQAISVCPSRPEAYLLLSRMYETTQQWQKSYTAACQGLAFSENEQLLDFVPAHSDYMKFQKAVSGWWIGRTQESRQLFDQLQHSEVLDADHKNMVYQNIHNLGRGGYPVIPYVNSAQHKLRIQFPGCDTIVRNHSQTMQDMFVLMALQGKRGGTYLEVGSAQPYHNNNTALLETQFGWSGLSIDIDQQLVNRFRRERKNPCIAADATSLDYGDLLREHFRDKHIDYLQLDCDPPQHTYQILTKIPFDQYVFGVITYEHDAYADAHGEYRRKSRELLSKAGYVLVAGNISPDWRSAYEDWWLHPDAVDQQVIDRLTLNHLEVLPADEYMFGEQVTPEKSQSNMIPVTQVDDQHWRATQWPTLEITTNISKKGCVVDCAFCPQRVLERNYRHDVRVLTLEKFQEALRSVPTQVRITFAGFTEPWLNSKATDMLLWAHQRGHPISVFTTGVGMTPDDVERIKHVPFAGNPNGGFCLHLPDEQGIAKHPINQNYIQTLDAFYQARDDIQNFHTMCMGDQVHHSVRHLFNQAHVPQFYNRAGNLTFEAMLKPELDQLRHQYKNSPVSMDPRTCGCVEELYHNVLLPNGDVSLCCMDYGLDNILGNLLQQTYAEIVPAMGTCYDICEKCENGVEPKTKQ